MHTFFFEHIRIQIENYEKLKENPSQQRRIQSSDLVLLKLTHTHTQT